MSVAPPDPNEAFAEPGRTKLDDAAFRILGRLSQDGNRKLRDVAAALVERAAGSEPAGPVGGRRDAG